MQIKDFIFWERASYEFINTKKIYIDMTEDLIAGILLSRVVYWHLPSEETGKTKLRVEKEGHYWIAKGREDWHEEIRITAKQYDRAIKILENLNLVEVKTFKFNSNPTKHVRLKWEVFLAQLNAKIEGEPYSPMVIPQRGKTNSPKGEERTSPKVNNDIDLSGRTLTKTTNKDYLSNITNNKNNNHQRSDQKKKYKIDYNQISKVQAEGFRSLLRQYLFHEEEIENIIYFMENENLIPSKEVLRRLCIELTESEEELMAYNMIAIIKKEMLYANPKPEKHDIITIDKEVDQLLKKLFPKGLHESKRKAIFSLYEKYHVEISIYQLQSILNGVKNLSTRDFTNFYGFLKKCFDTYLNKEEAAPLLEVATEKENDFTEEELLKLFS